MFSVYKYNYKSLGLLLEDFNINRITAPAQSTNFLKKLVQILALLYTREVKLNKFENG